MEEALRKPLYRVTQWYNMTRKHFKAIAEILNTHGASEDMILAFSRELVKHNPRFDSHKFHVASGYWD